MFCRLLSPVARFTSTTNVFNACETASSANLHMKIVSSTAQCSNWAWDATYLMQIDSQNRFIRFRELNCDWTVCFLSEFAKMWKLCLAPVALGNDLTWSFLLLFNKLLIFVFLFIQCFSVEYVRLQGIVPCLRQTPNSYFTLGKSTQKNNLNFE